MGFLEFLNGNNHKEMTTRGETNIKRLSNLGVIGFGAGISDKRIVRTPHYEITKSLEMFELNIIVNSAVNQLVSFIIPNKKVKISSKDKATVEWLEEWHELRAGIIEEFRNILITRIVSGQGYAETIYDEEEGKGVTLDNVYSYNDSSRIYVNPDVSEDGSDAFILQLPVGMKQFTYRGKPKTLTFYQVRYIKNYQYTMKRVYGCLISDDEIMHWKAGWSRDNIYGRSQLMAAIDADNIMQELISTWDTVIRTRRKDVKIYSIADAETGKKYSQKQMDVITDELQNTSSSVKLINIPLKATETSFNATGTYDLFEGVFDSVRRMVIMALLPQHLTPWNDSATTQGSEAAMPPFLLRIKSLQNEFIHFLNSCTIDNLRKSEEWLAKDATYVFDEPIIMGQDYYVRVITDMVSAGFINEKQGQQYLIKLGILDETILEEVTVGKIDGGKTKVGDDKEVLISYEDFKKSRKVTKEQL